MEIEIRDKSNSVVGKMSLTERAVSEGLLHESVLNYLANQRQGTHATKTKGLVSGGGKKPWRQKHTGRARAGSIRSPLWKGGGTIFGPLPRDYSYSMPKKAKKTAFLGALAKKAEAQEIVVLDSLALSTPKTKEMAGILKNLGLDGKSTLIIMAEGDKNTMLASRNIPTVSVKTLSEANIYDVLTHERLLITKDALQRLEVAQ